MAESNLNAEEDVKPVRAVIAALRKYADELRAKGVPVDDMIKDLETQVEEVLAAARRVREINAEDRLLTQKREHLRRSVDGLAGLSPDLVDGMSTIEYLKGAAEREAERRRRGKHPGN